MATLPACPTGSKVGRAHVSAELPSGTVGKLREAYRRLDAENQGQPEMPLDDFHDNEKLS